MENSSTVASISHPNRAISIHCPTDFNPRLRLFDISMRHRYSCDSDALGLIPRSLCSRNPAQGSDSNDPLLSLLIYKKQPPRKIVLFFFYISLLC